MSEYRDGYKAHVAVEPETRLVTGASLTPASAADGPTGVELLAGEEPGVQVLADSAYRSGEVRAALRRGRHHQAIEAIPLRRAVPAASTATISSSTTPRAPHAALLVTRSSHRLRQRNVSTSLQRRLPATRSLHDREDRPHAQIREHDTELVEARRAWRDGDFTDDYRQWRPMVERPIAWLVACGHRRVRNRGVERN